MNKKLLVMLGPTGTGKTDMSIKLLEHIHGEIISADSRQIYQKLDYSTNKLSPNLSKHPKDIQKRMGFWIQEKIRINFYDLVEPIQDFSVGQFVELGSQKMVSLWNDGLLPVIVGGTGFYIDGLIGQSPLGKVTPNLILRDKLSGLSTNELQKRLAELDSVVLATMSEAEKNNKVRLLRYIEIATTLGSVQNGIYYSPLKPLVDSAEIDVLKIGLTSSKENLYAQADIWVEQLIANPNFIYEMEMLSSDPVLKAKFTRNIIFGVGMDIIQHRVTPLEAKSVMKGQLHGYIRRQLRWFKRMVDVNWWDVSQKGWNQDVTQKVEKWYYSGK